MARKYELKRRAERQAETRQRIVEATVELHGSIGPANTTISAIADRAGVERLTVYRHFPDERALYGACSSHWNAAHPAPNLESWRGIADPTDRLRRALTDFYAWYRNGEMMLVNCFHDAPAIPALMEVTRPGLELIESLPAVLAAGWQVDDERRELLRAALGHAVALDAWRSLARDQELSDDQIIKLMIGMVCAAAHGDQCDRRFSHPE